MPRNYIAVLSVLFSLFLTACATVPEKTDPPLQRDGNYSEHRIYNNQGLRLFVRRWDPQQTTAKGNVVILHGTSLHGGLYEPVAKQLTAAGYRVYAYDMQGWGRSGGMGAAGFVGSFYDYADDLFVVMNTLKKNYPGVPNYVMGESLGGAVALYAALKDRTLCDGVITSAAGYKPNPELLGVRAPGFVTSVGLTLAQWGGGMAPEVPILESDAGIRLVVEDDAMQEKLLTDPYVAHGWLPAAYASTLVDASDFIEDNLGFFDRPILLLHGDRDVLVPLSSSREVFQKVNSSVKSLRVYDSPHTVLLERSSALAVHDIILFLNKLAPPQVVAQ